jgi:hypothetical protein
MCVFSPAHGQPCWLKRYTDVAGNPEFDSRVRIGWWSVVSFSPFNNEFLLLAILLATSHHFDLEIPRLSPTSRPHQPTGLRASNDTKHKKRRKYTCPRTHPQSGRVGQVRWSKIFTCIRAWLFIPQARLHAALRDQLGGAVKIVNLMGW